MGRLSYDMETKDLSITTQIEKKNNIFAASMAVKLFISGFPLDADEMALAQLISPHGNIDVMKIVREKKTKICKGYAFVEMKTEGDAASVIEALDGQFSGERQLTVRIVEEEPAEILTSAV